MKIRWNVAISGTVHGNANGVKPGDVMDVTDAVGAQYCALHYAEPVVDKKEERAVAPKGEERAKPEPDPEPEPEKTPRPGPKPRA